MSIEVTIGVIIGAVALYLLKSWWEKGKRKGVGDLFVLLLGILGAIVGFLILKSFGIFGI